ncbi:MAG: hypothetical protein ACOX9B_05200 [Candidatus Xenobium sp.]
MRSEERSVVGNYVSTAEVRLTTQTGPSHPRPGVGGVSTPRRPNAAVAADSGRLPDAGSDLTSSIWTLVCVVSEKWPPVGARQVAHVPRWMRPTG